MRIRDTLRKNKKNFIIYAILWLIAVIVFVMPISVAIVDATVDGQCDLGNCMTLSMEYIQNPMFTFGKVFTEGYLNTFIDALNSVSFVFFPFLSSTYSLSDSFELLAAP